MSLSSLLSIARTALLTHKRALEVTANNIANAQTPGYSRERLELQAATSLRTGEGWIGRGVTADRVLRARDQFGDGTFRRESGAFSQSSTLHDGLQQIEDAMGEPSDIGLAASIDKLFHGFADLASDPASPATRGLVVEAGERLAQQLNQLDSRVSQAAGDATARMQAQVAQANGLLQQIAQLNRDIQGSGGSPDPGLMDSRDNALDELSQVLSIQVVAHDDGTVTVLGNGANLVDTINATQLTVTGTGSSLAITDASGSTLTAPGGSLGGLLDLVDTRLPDIRTKLDSLATTLVGRVNAVHRTGYTASGVTNTDFFDPAGVTAGTIRIAAPIATSSAAVAASGAPLAGDGTVAQALADLGGATQAGLGGETFRGFYIDVVTGVGQSVQTSADDRDVGQTLADQADQRRTAVSGVSVDEEMVNMIAEQQAYGAAAKIISTAADMMKDLLDTI